VPLMFFPTAVVLIMAFQYVNPLSAKVWTRPNWRCNFLRPCDCLPFLHVGGFLLAVGGIGALLGQVVSGTAPTAEAVSPFSCSVGILLGVKLCEVLFARRFQRH